MPLTTLDPKTALVIIDLQAGIVARAGGEALAEVVARSAELAAAFRDKGLSVVLVNVDAVPPGRTEQARGLGNPPAGWTEIVTELDPQPTDHRVTKRTWGAFTNTDLEAYLKGRGVTQIVLTGVATSAGVESTARQAHELGFNVTLAVDAMADLSPEAHRHSVSQIFPRLGETGTAAQVIALMDKAA
ncbi:MAG: isochorismatase family protein [Caulobacteraceae bacterium]|nr:isochorismatase family protein [Caulobacteraceae bacterium]